MNINEDPRFRDIEIAILDGEYSWACFLLLKMAGCNPLQYLPYRTYNRLIKKNLATVGKEA